MSEAIIRVLQRTGKCAAQLFLAVCCLFAISHVAMARGCDSSRGPCNAQTQNSPTAIPDSQFAIGDFDGDRQPDLATVKIARFNSLHSRYWISFQLSKGRLQTIGVTGPAGGLVLLARDVNGDRALDLVLVTAWRHELVAILLNDGEGNFAAADPAPFGINAVSSRTQIGIAPRRMEDRTVLSFQYSAPGNPRHKTPLARKSEPNFSRSPGFSVTLLPSSLLTRAPPRSFLHV